VRIVSALFAILAFSTAAPQDSLDLHMRYGQPDLQRFVLRPDISMTVENGSDGRPCTLRIHPGQGLMTLNTAFDLLAEAAPPDIRNREIPASVVTILSGQVSVISVHRAPSEIDIRSIDDGKLHGVEEAEVKFTRTECTTRIDAPPNPQASSEFHARYGQPDLERFVLRPDVTLTAEYGPDGKACIFTIEPRQGATSTPTFDPPRMSEEGTLELLNEVAPPETRGTKRKGTASTQLSCGATTIDAYEDATIAISHAGCERPKQVQRATVNFRRPGCLSGSK